MSIPNFFSVERIGYTKVSDVFADVMKDMIDHGFTLINSSNGNPLSAWTAEVVSGGAGRAVGQRLYITSGSRPLYNGSARPPPYVEVTSIATVAGTTGVVTGLSQVRSDYDFPIWTVEPTDPVTLYTDVAGTVTSGVTANLTQVTVSRDSLGTVINAPTQFSFTLEASGQVDPLNESRPSPEYPFVEEVNRQPWRVQFVITDEQKAAGSVATKLQMSYDDQMGRVSISKITDDFGTIIDNVGAMGAAQPGGIFSDSDLNQGFYNRKLRVAAQEKTFPLSYMLSITDRGFFLGVYEGSWSTIRAATTTNSNYFNWVLVQRPVDRATGAVLKRGKAPVFHVNSVNYKYYKSVVREADILHPTSGPSASPAQGNITVVSGTSPSSWTGTGVVDTVTGLNTVFTSELAPGSSLYEPSGNLIGTVKSINSDTGLLFQQKPLKAITNGEFFFTQPNIQALRVLADVHSPDSHMIFNSSEQIALTEDKTYLLSFPHNLTTPRYRYTEELDMIGTTSSDVVMSGQDIQFTTYGEMGPRTYRALPANAALNTGLRLAVIWAPAGPSWRGPNEGSLGEIRVGDSPEYVLEADELSVPSGQPTRADPVFELVRGSLPKGLILYPEGKIAGTVEPAEYTESTMIKFTISAKNVEDTGYALRDFWVTFVPGAPVTAPI